MVSAADRLAAAGVSTTGLLVAMAGIDDRAALPKVLERLGRLGERRVTDDGGPQTPR